MITFSTDTLQVHTVIFKKILLQEVGPTLCGDENSDPEVMNLLGAELVHQFGSSL